MADPRAFISFDVDYNSNEKVLFEKNIKHLKTPFTLQDCSTKPSKPRSKWEAIVSGKIDKCNLVIVLVGKYMSSANGVDREITFAHSQNVPVFGVYVGGADNSSKLPKGLQRNRTITWNWDLIANTIDQAMEEKKNQ